MLLALEIDAVQVLDEQQQQVAVVQLLGQLGHHVVRRRLGIAATVQHVLDRDQVLADVLLRLLHLAVARLQGVDRLLQRLDQLHWRLL